MTYITYKGYVGRIYFSEEDEAYIGEVLAVNDFISFHGYTLSEAKQRFLVAIDDYLECAKEEGFIPNPPLLEDMSKSLGKANILVPDEMTICIA